MSRQGEEHTNKHLKFWWQIYHTDVKKNMSEEAVSNDAILHNYLHLSNVQGDPKVLAYFKS
jgi:hypothetical protein